MSCPENIKVTNLSGSFTINKAFSDELEKAMEIRGVSWALRKAMKVAPPMTVRFTTNANSSPASWTISFPQRGPMKAHDEIQRLDFQWNERKNPIIGSLQARAKPVEASTIDDAYLKEGWYDHLVMYEEEISDKEGFEACNVWGFMLVEGQRMFCRKTSIKSKKGEVDNGRTVYDYKSV